MALPRTKEELEAAALELDKQYAVTDLAAEKVAETAPKRKVDVTTISMSVLRRRCMEARDAGNQNIAVGSDLLIELMNMAIYAMKHGYVSKLTV